MNYLAHVFLAGDASPAKFGNLLGDFMKGIDLQTLPVEVRRGVELHRSVDHFTDHHPVPLRSAQRYEARFRRFGLILTDVFYDHFLTRHWGRFAESIPLVRFTSTVYQAIDDHWEWAPARLRRIYPAMRRDDWLASYGDTTNVDRALDGLSRRMKRTNPLAQGGAELMRNYDAIEADFLEFFPRLIEFTDANR